MPKAASRMSSKATRTKRRPQQQRRNDGAAAPGWLSAEDLARFAAGEHFALHERLGAHPTRRDGKDGTAFAIWAPNAERVSVVGDFNAWKPDAHPLARSANSGVWTGFVAGVGPGALYKYRLECGKDAPVVEKADPFAFRAELPPSTASVVATLDYTWGDAAWMNGRRKARPLAAPMSVYEVHLGSWRRPDEDPARHYGYRELAEPLGDWVEQNGFTHVELMPPLEHPFYGSWGYQITGYFAATSRYGSPQDLMYLIDRLHQRGIGVILDWVPSHFPADAHGLGFFDGTRLYEYPDPRVGFHRDWNSYIFNYGRPEVRSFLISNALFWIERYHVDAVRVDAVASMLYLDYSRPEGEWIRNKHGGRENLEAIGFLRRLNTAVKERHPDVLMIAEESTAWPMVSRPAHLGGLGFDMKWDMGWMHDTLEYFKLDPIHRKFHHNKITFRMTYAFSENFTLSLSHDEVVHGKASLLAKMAGDRWQQFANLRALYGYMWAQPGKKLLFMGGELGQWKEWNHDAALDWPLLEHHEHAGLRRWVADLNATYREEPALWRHDFDGKGFRWIDCSDADQSVVAFLRIDAKPEDGIVVVCNFTPLPRHNYRIGLPAGGTWREILNSDAAEYGGSGVGNMGTVEGVAMRYHEQPWSVCVSLPPLGVLYLQRAPDPLSPAVVPDAAAAATPDPVPPDDEPPVAD